MKILIAIVVALWAGASPTLAEESVRVSDAWARASVLASRPVASYLTIESAVEDRLLGVTTPVAGHVMIHAVEKDGDVSRMKHIETLEVPTGERITLAPGGMHLMLMGLQDKLSEGTTFPMTLSFENAGEITVEVSVLGIAAEGPREVSE
ncbi:MAG: copper chaperone PCu(A)C [Hoeflea sp.]|uniref:copper chaperone PCu(A)C n=1 Tax=unclassified Hoeflea TaxID=2614931 RepID=UPI001DD741AC|nr:copper chaperone PCu(A)C [Hoeflea sp.]MBU4527512.1 copper chaperone PCu(A)C [Alphaproteobacteria bacterium]MBU4543956.1 copper chaperone PCu(A)C [Alphaproteobacteria bacterium]MBU4552376.1 copper chaperone PCu(A)C [Alphaproteobacteria bacterium]MBV1726015.1 copper chaperone PCu(A)C [Hoeflea sp.]MBV1782373.1 copper chaperone PCu(A)C [Hoeflea sp.]